MGKIYRFSSPKYLSRIDPSDRSGTYVLGVGMIAGSAILSVYGRGLAMGIAWAIGFLFLIGLCWENYPRFARFFTKLIGWIGITSIAFTGAFAIYNSLERSSEADSVATALTTFGSVLFGLVFFKDVIRGARASAQPTYGKDK